jgi:glyoxylase-like metal-dependent hydrolase (beta-lactamase superfamily II)
VEVERFSTGRVRPKRSTRGVGRYLSGGWSDETFPVNVFVVRHPDGVLLFDTGQTARAARPGYHPAWHPYLRLARFELEPHDEIGRQLDPASVRWVVLSHLHTDHVGGIDAFPAAQVIVSRVEWEHAQGVAGRLRGYLPQHWPLGRPVLVDFTGPAVGPFPGSYDVACDGRLLAVPTPGHTSGHLSLVVRGDGAGWFLGGDLAHSVDELAAPIATFCREEHLAVLLTHDATLGP